MTSLTSCMIGTLALALMLALVIGCEDTAAGPCDGKGGVELGPQPVGDAAGWVRSRSAPPCWTIDSAKNPQRGRKPFGIGASDMTRAF